MELPTGPQTGATKTQVTQEPPLSLSWVTAKVKKNTGVGELHRSRDNMFQPSCVGGSEGWGRVRDIAEGKTL